MSDPRRPYLGCIVHFYHAGAERSFVAIVTGTVNEGLPIRAPMRANLRVDWDCSGFGRDAGEWIPAVPFSDLPKGGHWSWPPRVGGAE